MGGHHSTFTGCLRTHWRVLLVWSCLLVLPLGRSVEIPVLLMALLGAVRLVRAPRATLGDARARLLLGVFLAAWIPVLLSLPDAVEPGRTAVVALNHLRFLLSGLFVIEAFSNGAAVALFLRLSTWVFAAWIADGLVQHVRGVDLLGYLDRGDRLTSVFGEGNTKFGLTLAVLVPLLWGHAERRWPSWIALPAGAASVWFVIVGGSRAAWVAVCAAGGLYACVLVARRMRRWPQALALTALLFAAAGAGAYLLSDHVAAGVDSSLAGLEMKPEATANSIHQRLWIWRGAIAMFADNPVNGVGARCFRNAFARYASPEDPYFAGGASGVPLHAHQMMLEVAAETGAIGLAGLLLGWWLLARAAHRSGVEARARALPFAACVFGAYFPFNTHLAIYSAYWSQIVWYLIALYCAALVGERPAGSATAAGS